MNDVETMLERALHARAETVVAPPFAEAKLSARLTRRSRWVRFGTGAGLVATLTAGVVAATSLVGGTSHHNSIAPGGSPTGPPPTGPPPSRDLGAPTEVPLLSLYPATPKNAPGPAVLFGLDQAHDPRRPSADQSTSYDGFQATAMAAVPDSQDAYFAARNKDCLTRVFRVHVTSPDSATAGGGVSTTPVQVIGRVSRMAVSMDGRSVALGIDNPGDAPAPCRRESDVARLVIADLRTGKRNTITGAPGDIALAPTAFSQDGARIDFTYHPCCASATDGDHEAPVGVNAEVGQTRRVMDQFPLGSGHYGLGPPQSGLLWLGNTGRAAAVLADGLRYVDPASGKIGAVIVRLPPTLRVTTAASDNTGRHLLLLLEGGQVLRVDDGNISVPDVGSDRFTAVGW